MTGGGSAIMQRNAVDWWARNEGAERLTVCENDGARARFEAGRAVGREVDVDAGAGVAIVVEEARWVGVAP